MKMRLKDEDLQRLITPSVLGSKGIASKRLKKVILDKIYRNAQLSYLYTFNIIHSPVSELEPIIATKPHSSCLYAQNVIKGPFPAGERAIAENALYSLLYARYVIKSPFPEGEVIISNHPLFKSDYLKFLGSINQEPTHPELFDQIFVAQTPSS